MVGLLPGPGTSSSLTRLPHDSSDKDLKTVGRSARCCDNDFVTIAGGSRLILLSPLFLMSSCFAIIRLWAAKASRGESDGGISPSLYCIRGERTPNLEAGSNDFALRSINLGLSPMVVAHVRDVGSSLNIFAELYYGDGGNVGKEVCCSVCQPLMTFV